MWGVDRVANSYGRSVDQSLILVVIAIFDTSETTRLIDRSLGTFRASDVVSGK